MEFLQDPTKASGLMGIYARKWNVLVPNVISVFEYWASTCTEHSGHVVNNSAAHPDELYFDGFVFNRYMRVKATPYAFMADGKNDLFAELILTTPKVSEEGVHELARLYVDTVGQYHVEPGTPFFQPHDETKDYKAFFWLVNTVLTSKAA